MILIVTNRASHFDGVEDCFFYGVCGTAENRFHGRFYRDSDIVAFTSERMGKEPFTSMTFDLEVPELPDLWNAMDFTRILRELIAFPCFMTETLQKYHCVEKSCPVLTLVDASRNAAIANSLHHSYATLMSHFYGETRTKSVCATLNSTMKQAFLQQFLDLS